MKPIGFDEIQQMGESATASISALRARLTMLKKRQGLGQRSSSCRSSIGEDRLHAICGLVHAVVLLAQLGNDALIDMPC